jgi:hypothetical protein
MSPPVFNETMRNHHEGRYVGSTFCGCCGSNIESRNSRPSCTDWGRGYTCWISDTEVTEGVFTDYFIEVLPLPDGTYLVIKGNTVEEEEDD